MTSKSQNLGNRKNFSKNYVKKSAIKELISKKTANYKLWDEFQVIDRKYH